MTRVAGLVGTDEPAASLEEAFDAVARLCEALARSRPLVLVFEDVHWAQPALLDLIEARADFDTIEAAARRHKLNTLEAVTRHEELAEQQRLR